MNGEEDLPWTEVFRSGSKEDRERGESLLQAGKAGCLILAGGQGSRLGFAGPKGMMPVSPLLQKSLFQLFCERTKAASLRYGKELPLCIMTSPLNYEKTLHFFESNHFFGLAPEQVFFIQQEMLPFLGDNEEPVIGAKGKVLEGPSGNGDAIRFFFQQGVFSDWQKRGVSFVNVVLVDNALADPFDAELIGLTERTQSEVTLKAVDRLSPDEQMGVLVNREGRLKIVEYSELSETCSSCPYSSTSLFSFSMEFIRHLYEDLHVQLPYHFARKSISIEREEGVEKRQIWKRETFIFDLLDHCFHPSVLVCPREDIYAPLKNATGDKSPQTVREALLRFDHSYLERLTGVKQPQVDFELDPHFYYPTPAVHEKWRGRTLSTGGYIRPFA